MSNLTKEEYLKALDYIEEETTYVEDYETMPFITCNHLQKEIAILRQLINEHFDNPPLSFEELKEGMRIWDSERKCFLKITKVEVDERYRHFVHHYYYINMNGTTSTLFEENRFFRKRVE